MIKKINLKKNKKAVSAVITTILLVLLAIAIAAIIYASSKSFIQNMQKDSAIKMAKEQCGKRFNVELAACYKLPVLPSTTSTINLDLINLKETIPAGSSIILNNGLEERIIPLEGVAFTEQEITQGVGKSLTLTIDNTQLDLATFAPKTIKFVPVFTYKNERVLCNEIPEIDIKACQAS
jgi:FlaG/FlaF family flagellin (archaellin)